MQAYDFGIFKALSNELKQNGITNKISSTPIPNNDDEPYITINVADIKQTIGLQARAKIEILFVGFMKLQHKALNVLQKISTHPVKLIQDQNEIGTACLKLKTIDKTKIDLQAFITLKRIYQDG